MADRFEYAPDSSPERKRPKHEPKTEPCRSVIRLCFPKGLMDKKLLEITTNLAHQVNADPRKKPGGLAKELTKLYEFADLHNEGAEGPQDDLLGTARIDTEPSDPKGPQGEKAAIRIFSIYGQRKGGKPGWGAVIAGQRRRLGASKVPRQLGAPHQQGYSALSFLV